MKRTLEQVKEIIRKRDFEWEFYKALRKFCEGNEMKIISIKPKYFRDKIISGHIIKFKKTKN